MCLELVHFSQVGEGLYSEYLQDWTASEETIVPTACRTDFDCFSEVQNFWKSEESEKFKESGKVPSTLYFAVQGETVVGAISFRHFLNEKLKVNGGNIGFGIRPSKRGQGFAVEMLKQLICKIGAFGGDSVVITCDESNLGSIKTIERNGGHLEEFYELGGIQKRRYEVRIGKPSQQDRRTE